MLHTKEFINIGIRRLAVVKAGSGVPPVILETGLGVEADAWAPVQEAVASFTQVVRYDRAGRGESDPAPKPRSAQMMVDDLHNLLQQLDIPKPYLLVGQSFGGIIVRLFAGIYPDEVAGLVLVDPTHEDQFERISRMVSPMLPGDRLELADFYKFWTQGFRDPAQNHEGIDFPTSCGQVRSVTRLGKIPITVLSSGNLHPALVDRPEEAARLRATWTELHKSLTALSENARHSVVQDSGHFIQCDQPQKVVDAIRETVDFIRSENH